MEKGRGVRGEGGTRFCRRPECGKASRAQEQQDAGGTAGRIETGHEGLHHPGDLVDGLVLTNNPFTQAAFKVYGIWTTQGGVQFHPLDRTHWVPYYCSSYF